MNKTSKLLLVVLFLVVTFYWLSVVYPWILYLWEWIPVILSSYNYYSTLQDRLHYANWILYVFTKVQKMSAAEKKVSAFYFLLILVKYWSVIQFCLNWSTELKMLYKVFNYLKYTYIALNFLLGLERRVSLISILRRA